MDFVGTVSSLCFFEFLSSFSISTGPITSSLLRLIPASTVLIIGRFLTTGFLGMLSIAFASRAFMSQEVRFPILVFPGVTVPSRTLPTEVSFVARIDFRDSIGSGKVGSVDSTLFRVDRKREEDSEPELRRGTVISITVGASFPLFSWNVESIGGSKPRNF